MTDNINRHNINMAARLVDNQAITQKEELGNLRQLAVVDREHDHVPEMKLLKESARILHDIADKIRSLEIKSKVEQPTDLKFTPAPGFTIVDDKEEIGGVVSEDG